MPPIKGRSFVPVYFKDWWDNPLVAVLDRQVRSVWLDLYQMMWVSEERGVLISEGKPLSIQFLSEELLVAPNIMQHYIKQLLHTGLCSLRTEDGAICSPLVIRRANILKTKKNSGKMGGNPKLLKQTPDAVKQILNEPVNEGAETVVVKHENGDSINLFPEAVKQKGKNGAVADDLVNHVNAKAVNQIHPEALANHKIVDLWWELHKEYRNCEPVYVKAGKGNYPLAFKKLAAYKLSYGDYEKAFRCGFEDLWHQRMMEPAYAAEKFNTLLTVSPRKDLPQYGRKDVTDNQIKDSLDFNHD